MRESGENGREPRREISRAAIVSLVFSLVTAPCFLWWFFPGQWDNVWVYAAWAVGTLGALGACVFGIIAWSQKRTHRWWWLGIVGILVAMAWVFEWVSYWVLFFMWMAF